MVKKESFYLGIFNYIKAGKSPSHISKELGISKQKVYYYTKQLKKGGFIDKHTNGEWYVKVKTFSIRTRLTTNLHALQIKIPILSGEIKGSDWEVREELRNWIPKYKTFSQLGGLTIKNNNNKSISIFVHSRDIKDLKEIDKLSYEVSSWALERFKRDFHIVFDMLGIETKMLHIATEDRIAEGQNRKGDKFELDLDKKAEKIFSKDNIDAKAWIDGSPFNFTAETNDKEWKRAYLQMPFSIQNTLVALNYIAQNYASHVGVVEKLDKLLEVKEVRKHIKDKVKGQKTLLEFK